MVLSLVGIGSAFANLTMAGVASAFSGVLLADLKIVVGEPAAVSVQFSTPAVDADINLYNVANIRFTSNPVAANVTSTATLNAVKTIFFTAGVTAFINFHQRAVATISFSAGTRPITYATTNARIAISGIIDDPSSVTWQFVDASGQAADANLWRRVG